MLKDPPYSTGTEPEFDLDFEPKLDDSVLQWDDEMEDSTLSLEISPHGSRLSVSAINFPSTRSRHCVRVVSPCHLLI